MLRGREAGAHVSTNGSPLPDQKTGAHVSTGASRGVAIDPPHATAPHDRLRTAVCREEVKAALLGMGWKPAIVRTALAEAVAALQINTTFRSAAP